MSTESQTVHLTVILRAYEEAEEEPQATATQLCSTLPSHTSYLSNRAATALWKYHFCPCPFAWQFLISEPLTTWKSSIRKGERKKGPWKTAGTGTTHVQAERQSIYYTGLFTTPNSREGHLFPTNHQATLHMQKRWRACTLVTYSHAKM